MTSEWIVGNSQTEIRMPANFRVARNSGRTTRSSRGQTKNLSIHDPLLTHTRYSVI